MMLLLSVLVPQGASRFRRVGFRHVGSRGIRRDWSKASSSVLGG